MKPSGLKALSKIVPLGVALAVPPGCSSADAAGSARPGDSSAAAGDRALPGEDPGPSPRVVLNASDVGATGADALDLEASAGVAQATDETGNDEAQTDSDEVSHESGERDVGIDGDDPPPVDDAAEPSGEGADPVGEDPGEPSDGNADDPLGEDLGESVDEGENLPSDDTAPRPAPARDAGGRGDLPPNTRGDGGRGDVDEGPASCVPRTCASQELRCGTAFDGCGATLECGACGGDQSCQAGACVATLRTLDVVATSDNVLLVSNVDAAVATTAYPRSELSVGCYWDYSPLTGIQLFACASSLLYFNVDADIAGRVILEARLVFSVDLRPTSATTYAAWGIFDDWFADVTWDTAPRVVTGTQQVVQPPLSGQWEIDVTAIVQGWASGNFANRGFMIEPSNVTFPLATRFEATTLCSLESCPGEFRPRLQISYR